MTNLFSLTHVHGANIYMFWKRRSFILHKLCYNLLVFSPTQHIFISETQDQIVPRFFCFFFFLSLPARFFLSLTAYCGHSNQLRHLPALLGLLHIINTIIRMDHHLLNHPDWRISQSGSEQHCTTHLSYWIFYFGWVSWYRWDCWVNRNERLMIQ